jgi:hypothetical protein
MYEETQFCESCGHPCEGVTVDNRFSYEYGSERGVDGSVYLGSNCCEASVCEGQVRIFDRDKLRKASKDYPDYGILKGDMYKSTFERGYYFKESSWFSPERMQYRYTHKEPVLRDWKVNFFVKGSSTSKQDIVYRVKTKREAVIKTYELHRDAYAIHSARVMSPVWRKVKKNQLETV